MIFHNIHFMDGGHRFERICKPQFIIEDDIVYLKFNLVSNNSMLCILWKDVFSLKESN